MLKLNIMCSMFNFSSSILFTIPHQVLPPFSFTPHSCPPSSTHLLRPTPTTSSPLARHLAVSLKMQFSIGPSPLAPLCVTSPSSPLTLPLLAPPVPLFSPLSPSSLILSPFQSCSVSLTLSLTLKVSLDLPPSPFHIASPLILLTRGILCFSHPPPPKVTLQPLHHPHLLQVFTHIHTCVAVQAN